MTDILGPCVTSLRLCGEWALSIEDELDRHLVTTAPQDRAPQDPAAQDPAPDVVEPTVRSSLDLSASRHAALLREAADAGVEVGWPVRPQHVLRAMFEEFIDAPDAVARVRDRIRRQGRPTRRRRT